MVDDGGGGFVDVVVGVGVDWFLEFGWFGFWGMVGSVGVVGLMRGVLFSGCGMISSMI